MPKEPSIHAVQLADRARARGLDLDAERAAALQPQVESLLGRLLELRERIPMRTAPSPHLSG